MPKISYCCYDAVDVNRAMQNDINKLKEKVKELEYRLSGNYNYNISFDDQFYKDNFNTLNIFDGDDGK